MNGAVRIRRRIGSFLFRFYPPEVLQKLADGWADDRRWLDALKTYTLAEQKYTARAGRTDPFSVGMRARRAWCLVMIGKPTEGAELYRTALDAKRLSGDSVPPTAAMLEERLAEAQAISGTSTHA
jgi:uncharacterized protein YciW